MRRRRPCRPASVRRGPCPGCGIALAPAEAFGARAQAFDEMALRERLLGLLGIDLRVVENAELDRVQAELFRHLVDGDLQRHRCPAHRPARASRCLRADRAPRAASPSCGWRRHRAAASGRTAVSGLPPGRSPDQLSWPIAVILPSCVAPMRMRWIVAGRCVVLLNISGRVQRHLHRPPGRPRAQRREQRIGPNEQLAAETAADVGRDEPNVLLRDARASSPCRPRSSRSSGWTSRA